MEKELSPATIGGSVEIPGSKSHTIRALLIATLAKGVSQIKNPLYSADTNACIDACRKLGATIHTQPDRIEVIGNGGVFPNHPIHIDVGNSGTTLYLLAAIAALSQQSIHFTGDEQIQRRTAKPLLQSLQQLGAEVTTTNGCAPFTIKGPLKGGKTTIECPTSQYLSALLLACPFANQKTVIEVPLLNEQPYIEMTLAWLKKQPIQIQNENFKRFIIGGKKETVLPSYNPIDSTIPADFSSASFFLVAAALSEKPVQIIGPDQNDTQGDKAILAILEKMGAKIQIEPQSITMQGGDLKGIDLDLNAMPDALPILAVAAAYAKGKTRIYNVAHARLKETDRVAVMAKELAKLGVKTEEHPDGLTIYGGEVQGGKVDGHHDHRIVMAFAIASLKAKGKITITTAEAAAITFPHFFEKLESISIPPKEEQ